ncbi:EAL domain-containing protein [Pseudoduganella namucuonensis]|uniref:PAS domain S-box-containing protein/diguanylate cyclase (GGDEF) domain-containing protein n=1 Tax=Pseudoduganella namucuonensis TaxID=1035707 RepID=A0A1I7ILN6_9BURK|nr:EAL domain-containing protein [Pseudoduganella namucuonensis]SFU73832.1 PAS domain S-box-containing protein/diguanylate cyclase (GGDEF) domain-containing protein [Pseudoduganella namucuonensis]
MYWYALFAFAALVIFPVLCACFIVRLARWMNRFRVLAREGAMFRDMIDLVRDVAVTVHDMEDGGRVIYANDAACLHFGVSRATLLTWRPTNWNPHFDASDVEALYRTFKSGDSVVFETEHRVASGELVPVEVMQLCQVREGARITIGYTRDIRARKAEEARRLEYERNQSELAGLGRLSRFIGNTPGYFYTVVQRPDGSIAMPFASPGIHEIYGLRPEDVEQDVSRLVATIHPDDEVRNLAAMAESARTMSPFHVEFRVHHPEKGGRWVEARSQPQREPDGSVLWHGFTHDITERKQMELALIASKQEFHILAENLPDSIVRYDRNARHIYLNPSAWRELAVGTSELPNAALDKLWDTPSGAFYRRKVQQVLDTSSPVEFEFVADPLPSKSEARYYHVHVVPEYSHDGQLIGALGRAHDISERKRAEKMLIQREREFHSLAENLPDNLARWDREGRYLYVNPTHESTLRVPAAHVLGKTIGEAFPDGRFTPVEQAIATVIETGQPQRFTRQPVPQEDGTMRLHEISLTPEWNAHGEIMAVLAIGRDMTEQFRLQTAIASREQELRALAESSPGMMGSFHLRPDGTVCMPYVSPNILEHFGLHPQDVVDDATPLLMRNHPDDARRVQESIAESARTMLPWREEYRILHPTLGERWMESHTKPQRHPDGGIVWHGYVCDITERKRMEELLRKRAREFRALVENSPDTIARYDRDCRRVYANPRMVADMGGDMVRILGTTPAQFPGGASALEYENILRQVCERGEERNFELRWKTGDAEVCTQVRMTPEFDGAGEVAHVLAVGRDITEIDQYRKQIHHQAFSDALTGLPNRMLLSDRIHQAIADAAYHGHQFGLMMLDLDNFKEINDTMGHGVGDELLRTAAKRLLACVRSYDTVARLGGDEFSVLLPNMRRGDDLATIAGKILHELAEPFVLDGQELFVTCSIGIALYPADSTEIDALYKYADSAMYHAKKMGRNNFQFYEPEFTVRSQERMEVETALRKAQEKGELVLYYQPQIELQTGRLVSAEALLRWQRPGHGMVAPDRFIPIAEASGMILGIGEWVLLSACQDAVCWNRGRATPVRVAVNLSTRQFIRNDLVGAVRRVLAETGCSPAWLELEITESLLLEDSTEVAAMLAALHEIGLSISIDDFGTGYSALSYLSRFPVSQIKIDRSFVSEIPAQRNKCELVKAMLSIASALHLETVAEGVETIEQAEYLTAHGCRLAQGYLFGRPMRLAEFEAIVAAGLPAQGQATRAIALC